MVNPNRFYTYAYLREDRTPYYIGKGTGRRIYSKTGRPCVKPKDKSRIIFLKQNIIEKDAFKHEIYMIAVFGRKDLGTGILHNRTNGGDGVSGHIHSEETKRKISEANKNRSEETRRKLSESNKGKTRSEETRGKMSESKKGKNNYLYGKSIPEEIRRKMSEANRDKKWWNDGNGIIKFSEKCPGKDWVLGRGKSIPEEIRRKLSEANKDKKWWNDGCGNTKFAEECPGDGWILGRGTIPKKSKVII